MSVILTIVLDTDTTRHDPSLQEYVRWVPVSDGCKIYCFRKMEDTGTQVVLVPNIVSKVISIWSIGGGA